MYELVGAITLKQILLSNNIVQCEEGLDRECHVAIPKTIGPGRH